MQSLVKQQSYESRDSMQVAGGGTFMIKHLANIHIQSYKLHSEKSLARSMLFYSSN